MPAFRDKRVRVALDMAIDRDFITRKLLRGGQLPAYTFVPPGIANYTAGEPAGLGVMDHRAAPGGGARGCWRRRAMARAIP